MTINAAVIGCGEISKFHFSGLEKYGADVKWVCDLNPDAAAPWMKKFNAEYCADYRRALNDPTVNVVFVTVISRLHKEICLAAVNAGKAVVCEKTLTENAADSLAVVRAAKARGVQLYTSYMKRFIPAVEKAKEILPGLGRIFSTHIRGYHCWGNLWDTTVRDDFFKMPQQGSSTIYRKYGGGILVCGGSHLLDLMLFLIGRPERVYASFHQPQGCDYDLQAAALMETAQGIVHYEVLAHPHDKIGFLRDGWDEKIEINAAGGRLEIFSAMWNDPSKSSLLVYYDNRSGNVTEYRFEASSPFERAVTFFCRQIEKGEQGAQSIWSGYEVDELIEQIKNSGTAHRPILIPWKN